MIVTRQGLGRPRLVALVVAAALVAGCASEGATPDGDGERDTGGSVLYLGMNAAEPDADDTFGEVVQVVVDLP